MSRTGPESKENIFSLVKHQILCKRDEEISFNLPRYKCETRANDLRIGRYNKKTSKDNRDFLRTLIGKDEVQLRVI